ncbi:MAG: hypothetical protein J6C87_00845 [Bacteroides sp.]|nr:hypothetical protein [Bacteroides sp.]
MEKHRYDTFVRNVIEFKEQGDRLLLTTVSGDLGDVLPDNDLDLDTDIYVDFNQPTRMTRSGVTVDNYNRYIDDEGVIHPAVIILEEAGVEYEGSDAETRSPGGKVYYTAEDIARSNASFNIINVNKKLGTFSLNFSDKKDDDDKNSQNKDGVESELKARLYIKDTQLKAKAGVRVNIKTKWFKLKSFECAVYGDFGLDLTTGLEIEKSLSTSKEEKLAQFSSFSAVFWVGPIPVAIKCDAGLQSYAELSLTGKCHFETDFSFKASYDAGVYYSGGWSERKTSDGSVTADFSVVNPFEATASAEVGLKIYAGLKLYDIAGPKVTFGPSIGTEFGMAVNAKEQTFDFTTSGAVTVGGKLSAEIKIWKWALASWSKKYTIWEKDLWDEKASIPYN